MSASLVGSEMCIRDSCVAGARPAGSSLRVAGWRCRALACSTHGTAACDARGPAGAIARLQALPQEPMPLVPAKPPRVPAKPPPPPNCSKPPPPSARSPSDLATATP
eukprot:6387972-Alexandrium_andersonii.AAC.1